MLKESTSGIVYSASKLYGDVSAERITAFTDPIFQTKGRAAKFAKRAQQHQCWGYRVNGEVVMYFWLSEDETPLWRKAVLRSDSAYIWDCFTAEEFRRRGYFTKALEDARKIADTREVLTAVVTGNDDSARVIAKQFEPIARYRVERFGPLYRTNGRFGRVLDVELNHGF